MSIIHCETYPEFIIKNKPLFEHTNFPDSYIVKILTDVWYYGNTQWEKGYNQGIRGVFDDEEIE
jgi:hypothetical protein